MCAFTQMHRQLGKQVLFSTSGAVLQLYNMPWKTPPLNSLHSPHNGDVLLLNTSGHDASPSSGNLESNHFAKNCYIKVAKKCVFWVQGLGKQAYQISEKDCVLQESRASFDFSRLGQTVQTLQCWNQPTQMLFSQNLPVSI